MLVGQLLRGSAVAFLLRMGGAALAFAFNVILARLIGAEGAGVYYLALVAASVCIMLGRLGLDNVLLRLISQAVERKAWGRAIGVYWRGMTLSLIASTVVAVLLFVSAPLLAAAFESAALEAAIRIVAFAVPPMSLALLHSEAIRALGKVFGSALVGAFLQPAAAVIALMLLGAAFGASGAAASYVAGAWVTLLVGLILWRSAAYDLASDADSDAEPARVEGRELFSVGLPLLLVTSMSFIMAWADTVMLGLWESEAEVGIYGAAIRTATLVQFVLVAVNTVAAPRFAALFDRGHMAELGRFARLCGAVILAGSAPALLLLVMAPAWVLTVFGEGFERGALALGILAAGQFVNAATGPVGYLLMMTGHEKLLRNITIFAVSLNVALNAVLIPPFGINGAAIATATSLAVLNMITACLVRSKLSLWPVPFFR